MADRAAHAADARTPTRRPNPNAHPDESQRSSATGHAVVPVSKQLFLREVSLSSRLRFITRTGPQQTLARGKRRTWRGATPPGRQVKLNLLLLSKHQNGELA